MIKSFEFFFRIKSTYSKVYIAGTASTLLAASVAIYEGSHNGAMDILMEKTDFSDVALREKRTCHFARPVEAPLTDFHSINEDI